MQDPNFSIVVLVSGGGTNLQAMIDAVASGELPVTIQAVISNVEGAYALERAASAGIEQRVINHREFPTREAFDAELASTLQQLSPDLIVLAGFMRILSDSFFQQINTPMINIHPSLLPAYPGLNTHARAIADRASHHGASVHFVTPELDAGPVIVRGAVPVHGDDTPESLQARVHQEEYRIYPLAIRWFAERRLSIVDGRVLVDNEIRPEQGLDTPQPD